jgi:excisionase family DNA binding protein
MPRARANPRTVDQLAEGASSATLSSVSGHGFFDALLTADEVAVKLRLSRKAVYAMVERRQLPGVVRIGRRVRVRQTILLEWLSQEGALSLEHKR